MKHPIITISIFFVFIFLVCTSQYQLFDRPADVWQWLIAITTRA